MLREIANVVFVNVPVAFLGVLAIGVAPAVFQLVDQHGGQSLRQEHQAEARPHRRIILDQTVSLPRPSQPLLADEKRRSFAVPVMLLAGCVDEEPSAAEAPRPFESVQIIQHEIAIFAGIVAHLESISQPATGVFERLVDFGIAATDRRAVGVQLHFARLEHAFSDDERRDARDGHAAVTRLAMAAFRRAVAPASVAVLRTDPVIACSHPGVVADGHSHLLRVAQGQQGKLAVAAIAPVRSLRAAVRPGTRIGAAPELQILKVFDQCDDTRQVLDAVFRGRQRLNHQRDFVRETGVLFAEPRQPALDFRIGGGHSRVKECQQHQARNAGRIRNAAVRAIEPAPARPGTIGILHAQQEPFGFLDRVADLPGRHVIGVQFSPRQDDRQSTRQTNQQSQTGMFDAHDLGTGRSTEKVCRAEANCANCGNPNEHHLSTYLTRRIHQVVSHSATGHAIGATVCLDFAVLNSLLYRALRFRVFRVIRNTNRFFFASREALLVPRQKRGTLMSRFPRMTHQTDSLSTVQSKHCRRNGKVDRKIKGQKND